jgi:hypothetical protein
MPALTGRWPSMQLSGSTTSRWRFDGGFIGGEELGQQIAQRDQVFDRGRNAGAHHEVKRDFASLKQWFGFGSWMGKCDGSAIAEPVNVDLAIANDLWHPVRGRLLLAAELSPP